MGKYKYKIEKSKGGYYFRLFPNNSNTQEIGRSNTFDNIEECKNALTIFKKSGEIFKNNPELCTIIKTDNNKYIFKIYFNENKFVFYRKSEYVERRKCNKAIESIIINIDAVTEY
ncbi:MAG: hypothetical protein Q4B40_01780 [Clostridia bacterium]|nr:hypothetical protein [Clostridia bacterium]